MTFVHSNPHTHLLVSRLLTLPQALSVSSSTSLFTFCVASHSLNLSQMLSQFFPYLSQFSSLISQDFLFLSASIHICRRISLPASFVSYLNFFLCKLRTTYPFQPLYSVISHITCLLFLFLLLSSIFHHNFLVFSLSHTRTFLTLAHISF
jgi:hypothetical protein